MIYVVGHKPFKSPPCDIYKPIQVGNGPDMGISRDNTGDNIAQKNSSFCELTALYWIWKNDQRSDVLGLCHYRRFFIEKPFSNSLNSVIGKERIDQLLDKSDIILPSRTSWSMSVEQYYSQCDGRAEDYKALRTLLQEGSHEYLQSFERVSARHFASYCNLFIAKRGIFESYCTWLFDVLFSLEERIDISSYTPEERRVFGYLGEILLNVWVEANSLRVSEIPIACSDISRLDHIRKTIRSFRGQKRKN